MQEYYIYWIEEEFCFHYFYKSDILFRFLHDYMSGQEPNGLVSQFNYVTREVPFNELVVHIKKYHSSLIEVNNIGKNLVIKKKNNLIFLDFHKRYMRLSCKSFQEADALLFQPLKSFDPSFFIIQKDTMNAGWLTPVKKEVII